MNERVLAGGEMGEVPGKHTRFVFREEGGSPPQQSGNDLINSLVPLVNEAFSEHQNRFANVKAQEWVFKKR